MEHDRLVTVRSYDNPIEAHLARSFLEAADIQSFLMDEQIIGVHPGLNVAVGGVKLQVAAEDFEEAARLLEQGWEDPTG